MSRRGLFVAVSLTLAAFGAPRAAHAEEPTIVEDVEIGVLPVAEIDDAATIAGIELRRGDPAGLDPFLAPTASKTLRRRAIVALGRIGDRPGVEARLRVLLERGGNDLNLAVWAAGLSGIKALVPTLLPLVDRGSPTTRGWALYALGDAGDKRADGWLGDFLASKDAAARVPASYAAVALEAERYVEALVDAAVAAPPELRARATADAWRLCGARRRARSTKAAPWAGDAGLARRFAPLAASDPDPEVRVFAHRALASLLPATLAPNPEDPADPVAVALGGAADRDPRVVADVAARFLAKYEGPGGTEALWTAGYDADALVRESVAETLAAKPSPARAPVAEDLLAHEQDVRVRLALAVAVAANGNLTAARAAIEAAQGAGADPARAGVALAKALGAAAKTDPAARDELFALGCDPKAPILVREAALDAAGALGGADALRHAREALKDADPIVRSSAASLFGEHGSPADVPFLAERYDPTSGRAEQDVRQALVDAIGKLAAKGELGAAGPVAEALLSKAMADPAPVVRATARDGAKPFPALAAAAAASDPRPNEWAGLPRPKGPIGELDLSQGEGPLSEAEILRLAEEIRTKRIVVLLDTDAGAIVVRPDPVWTPVHAVNLVLLAAAGVTGDTTWHRVVPGFVIQGGDPRGDGSGDAGYSVPDEISPHASFLRGTLGMPKSVKDTGGCQLFLMHMSAPHLDQRYTAFGETVRGLETIDRIRVGDRIRKALVLREPDLPR